MSIHKSKGLEFPVVFLAGMGKKFNKQDAYGKLLIDLIWELVPITWIWKDGIKAPTLKKHVFKEKNGIKRSWRELRVLYVAMTRAKESLS